MSTPYQNILCPIDLSDISTMAASWSRDLATDLRCELTLLHVIDTALANVGNLVAVPGDAAAIRGEAERAIGEWAINLGVSGANVRIEEGAPADVIVRIARDEEADLVVMGTHGRSGLQKLLLGSVMEKVLHRVNVPLMSFSPRTPDGPHAPKRILLAIDFGGETQSVVRHGVWLAEHFGAELVGAHAVPVPYVVLNDRSMERLTPEQLERLQDSLTVERTEKLAALFSDRSNPVEVVSTVGSAFRMLMAAVEEHDIDLVVMGRGGHGQGPFSWVGSTCHKLVRSARCPIVIVPQ